MKSSPEKDAIDIITAAIELAEVYKEQIENDSNARIDLRIMKQALSLAQKYGTNIQDKADDWWEAQKARLYPHPTAREKAEHNET